VLRNEQKVPVIQVAQHHLVKGGAEKVGSALPTSRSTLTIAISDCSRARTSGLEPAGAVTVMSMGKAVAAVVGTVLTGCVLVVVGSAPAAAETIAGSTSDAVGEADATWDFGSDFPGR
jgi:hypothetical protein